MTGIEKAIAAAGGQAELGALLDPPVTQQAIAKMKASGYCPVDRAIEISKRWDIELAELVAPSLREVVSAPR